MARKKSYAIREILVLTPPERRRTFLSVIGVQESEGFHNPEAAQKLRRVDNDGEDVRYHVTVVHSVEQARRQIRKEYFNVVVVDEARTLPDGEEVPKPPQSWTRTFFEDAKSEHVADPSWRADRTLMLLEDKGGLEEGLFEAGRLCVGGWAVWPLTEDQFFDAINAISRRRARVGKTALCLAGGGIEGMIYEAGVLRALDELFIGRGVNDFDIYCGISAGAILGCFLANGIPPEEVVRAFSGDSTQMDKIGRKQIFAPAYKEMGARLLKMMGGWFLSPKRALGGLPAFYMKSIPAGFFSLKKMQEFITAELGRPGRTNDFRKLAKELYIGATDQDTSEHVVFGDDGWDEVPIADAVRASASLVPFYAPTWIRGRWFVDGSYTRTSEFDLAVQKGATLVVIIDPLVPIRSGVSGYVRRKGGLFAGIQGVKAVVHTRFQQGLRRALERYPEVDFIVIVPEEDDMRLMSGSPMRYNYRVELEELAYQETLLRVEESYPQLSGELARHGFRIRQPVELRRGG